MAIEYHSRVSSKYEPTDPEDFVRLKDLNGAGATGGPAEWGRITGDLTDQTDLQAELDRIEALAGGTGATGPAGVWGQITGTLADQLDLHAELSRIEDLAAVGGIVGMFGIDQENGNLYFVSDAGVRNPFVLEGGNLYYVLPGD